MKEPPKKKITHHVTTSPVHHVKKRTYSDLLGLTIILLLGIIIYSNSFNCSFHFDDYANILDNPKIHNLSDVKTWWNYAPNRPVAIFTFVCNYHFNHLDVRYYHLVNLTIHLINALLVWWLIFLIFSSPALKDDPVIRHKKVIAFFTALLFVSHPLATQSVTYIIQRMASLAAMFYLFSLALYMKARLSDKGNISKALLFTGSLISAVLAMLSKENAFTLPFAIVLIEFFFLSKNKLSINFRDYRVILLIAALIGMIIIIPLKFSFSIFEPIPPSSGHAYTVTPFNYFLTQLSVIVRYIQLLLLPVNQNLDYDFPISNTFFEIKTLLSFLVLLSLIIFAVLSFKKYRIISFGIFWFFLTLSIESSFIPIKDVIYEHRTYLPSFGFFLILSSGICLLLWNKYKYLAITIFVIIIGSNSYLTYERNKVWKDDLSLWNDNVAKTPDLPRALVSRGFAYNNLGQFDKAITDFSRAIGINPDYADAWYNRGVAHHDLGQLDKAVPDFSRAIGINPDYSQAYNNRGNAYGALGQYDKAIADYSKAIGINTKFTDAWYNRGVIYGNLGQFEKAIADYTQAISIDPDYDQAYNNRGNAYADLGQYDKAIADFSKAIEINKGSAPAYYNRGVAYANHGQWDKAIADYSKVIEIFPDYTNAYINRGVIYDHLSHRDKAIADYSMAIEIDPKNSTAYGNRGAAYANLGQFQNAIADFSKALEIDPKNSMAHKNREIAHKQLHNKKK
jgi:tetratricopeptide (TPR) repeat protein